MIVQIHKKKKVENNEKMPIIVVFRLSHCCCLEGGVSCRMLSPIFSVNDFVLIKKKKTISLRGPDRATLSFSL